MTREEAIQTLKIIDCGYSTSFVANGHIAMGMAIKALEQETSDDAVSREVFEQIMWERDVAIEQLKELGYGFGEKPKTGHWIIIDDCEKFIAKCSECGRIEDSRMISKYPYCHCGARMVEPQEGEEQA